MNDLRDPFWDRSVIEFRNASGKPRFTIYGVRVPMWFGRRYSQLAYAVHRRFRRDR